MGSSSVPEHRRQLVAAVALMLAVAAAVRELAVVGGSGMLRRASGHVLWRTAKVESKLHAVLELDVHASVPAAAARSHSHPLLMSSASE
uniref:Dirigent protein n=1 Tax=Oryza punctata TaxID=4537 RepID=A0A0E0LG55_ORYPU